MVFPHLAFLLPCLLSTVNNSNDKTQNQPSCIRVCTSPACRADGATDTLLKLQALTSCDVQEGPCTSLCGNGPIVVIEGDNKKYRKMKGDKLNEFLHDVLQADLADILLEAYECIVAGDRAFDAKDWNHAIELYERAFQMAYSTVLHLQASSSNKNMLQCWIRARRNQASAYLELGQTERALLTAQGACNLSQNQDGRCFLVLAQAYQALDQSRNEKDAIERFLSLMENSGSGDERKRANERRTWQFRFDKLSRELASS